MDFSAVCRTCLSTDALSPIFADNVDPGRHATTIFIVAGIKVQINDGLPQQMCTDCLAYIKKSLDFRGQCKQSETKLLQQSYSLQNYPTLTKNNAYEECDTLIEEKYSNVLKIELKCEYDFDQNIEIVKSEIDSDLDNERLSCSIDINKENEGKNVTNNLTVNSSGETSHLEGKSSDETPCLEGKGSDDTPSLEGKSSDQTPEMELKNEKSQNKKNKVQRVSCPECKKDLSARSLSAHLKVKHGGLRCGYCKMECSSREAVEAHAAACPHKRKRRACVSSKELVTCEVCNKEMQRASLRMHQAVKHRGLGPVCEHCGRRFGNKLRLSEHLRAKHGHEKLKCGHCEFKSSSRAALENHERRHRGDKPYVCETCGAKFHAAYLLAQHRHSHRTDKRVKCTLCGAAFKAANSLHAHRLARHGARRHHCPLCTRVYSCRHYAVKHMRSVHGFKGTVPPLRVDPAPS